MCTDVAGMGIDIQDLNFSVNLGKNYIIQLLVVLKLMFVQEFLRTAGSLSSRVEELGEVGLILSA